MKRPQTPAQYFWPIFCEDAFRGVNDPKNGTTVVIGGKIKKIGNSENSF
jgi:hypothetical protein